MTRYLSSRYSDSRAVSAPLNHRLGWKSTTSTPTLENDMLNHYLSRMVQSNWILVEAS